MKTGIIVTTVISALLCSGAVSAQYQPHTFRNAPTSDFHAGLHSGSWTLRRSALLEDESKDPYRSCADPYCNRCAKHLADYGHEYQYLGGPNQQQPWYRGTAGSAAVTTRRGYDQHGIPYARRGQPAAVMSWEYRQALNHAIWEQVNARNAVAAEEAARDRLPMLEQLFTAAAEQCRLTKGAWEQFVAEGGHCINEDIIKVDAADAKIPSACSKTYKQFAEEMRSAAKKDNQGHSAAEQGLCAYCLATARYQFDCDYVALVRDELARAKDDYLWRCAAADEAVRIALLSKDDADKATRFVRIQNKPPKIKEAEATREYLEMIAAERQGVKKPAAEASETKTEELKNEDDKAKESSVKPSGPQLLDE
ncbi:MAG: hypothetical protein LBT89_00970 [Planctomycetaceae bacterium]|jgi:hypothetical protein|nr:hypothetical protein [Planctomycetaceae bacterium]